MNILDLKTIQLTGPLIDQNVLETEFMTLETEFMTVDDSTTNVLEVPSEVPPTTGTHLPLFAMNVTGIDKIPSNFKRIMAWEHSNQRDENVFHCDKIQIDKMIKNIDWFTFNWANTPFVLRETVFGSLMHLRLIYLAGAFRVEGVSLKKSQHKQLLQALCFKLGPKTQNATETEDNSAEYTYTVVPFEWSTLPEPVFRGILFSTYHKDLVYLAGVNQIVGAPIDKKNRLKLIDSFCDQVYRS